MMAPAFGLKAGATAGDTPSKLGGNSSANSRGALALLAMLATSQGLDLGLDEQAQAELLGGIMAVVNIGLRLATRSAVAP